MSYTPTTTRRTYTRFGNPSARARGAIAQAFADSIDLDARAPEILGRAGRAGEVAAYGELADSALDEAAQSVARAMRPVTAERDRLHRLANDLEAEQLAGARRVSSQGELGRPA